MTMQRCFALAAIAALCRQAVAQDDQCKAAHSSKGDCNADAKCTWCTAAAVPSSCHTKENAKQLPPGVFSCDTARRRRSEVLGQQEVEALGIVWRGNATQPSSHEEFVLALEDLPADFSWCNKDGVSYCTMTRNQHIPHWCGSCWAFGAVSALADRVKIARKAQGADINPSVQHILNCGDVGRCDEGALDGPYQWLFRISERGEGLSYETSQPYLACSSESQEGFCGHIDTTCKPINIARTCARYEPCTALSSYPNISISDYGSISGADAMMKEIYARGPLACDIDANPLLDYESGIIKQKGQNANHVVSVVGWGTDLEEGLYWIARNSWGEYWGEMGYARVGTGALLLEEHCAWAVVKSFTAPEFSNQVHCHVDGDKCKVEVEQQRVVPPPRPEGFFAGPH